MILRNSYKLPQSQTYRHLLHSFSLSYGCGVPLVHCKASCDVGGILVVGLLGLHKSNRHIVR